MTENLRILLSRAFASASKLETRSTGNKIFTNFSAFLADAFKQVKFKREVRQWIEFARDEEENDFSIVIMLAQITFKRSECISVTAFNASIIRGLMRVASQNADRDSLTGLANGRRMNLEFMKAVQEFTGNEKSLQEEGYVLAVMFLDLNDFKNVNDSYGHNFGDIILRFVATRINNSVEGQVYRKGGDEFVVILPKVKKQALQGIAERIYESVSKPYEIEVGQEKRMIRITISIGISIFPDHSRDLNQLIQFADEAMYDAKSMKSRGCRTIKVFRVKE
mgnify:CR=1 FL=1